MRQWMFMQRIKRIDGCTYILPFATVWAFPIIVIEKNHILVYDWNHKLYNTINNLSPFCP